MKVLKVIHGYPPTYNAGSEVYSQNLCHELAKDHEVHVFTREENPFLPNFSVREEPDLLNPSVQKHLVNIPLMRQRYRYSHSEVDALFGKLMDQINPDIVHIGHLNHLSTTLVTEAKSRSIPILYTLHDYWLMCARGQFLQRNPPAGEDAWKFCDGQEDRKCAERCYSGYFSGIPSEEPYELDYWTHWFEVRTQHMKEVIKNVDLFVAPARYLLKKYKDHYGISDEKLVYLDYGFNHERLQNRARNPEDKFVFGYIGTHTPQKGIHHLLEAFGHMKTDCQLKIWGRARGEITDSLKAITDNFSSERKSRVSWEGEYRNENIVQDVFNHVDAIVCPSIWEENSPLVIHEAQQVRLPVVTAMIGGMAEYVHHEINGLLFEHRNIQDLTDTLERMAQNPVFARTLGARGYLYSEDGDVPEISEHIHQIEALYTTLINNKKGKSYGIETRAMAHHI